MIRTLILFVIVTSIVSAGIALYTYYIEREYVVFANVSCDPGIHSCFVGDGEYTPLWYAKIAKEANSIPTCDGWLDQCAELTCDAGDESCTIEYCTEGEEVCYGPVQENQ